METLIIKLIGNVWMVKWVRILSIDKFSPLCLHLFILTIYRNNPVLITPKHSLFSYLTVEHWV